MWFKKKKGKSKNNVDERRKWFFAVIIVFDLTVSVDVIVYCSYSYCFLLLSEVIDEFDSHSDSY